MYPSVSSTEADPLGEFCLFKVSADSRTIRDATPARRKINYDLAKPPVERMEKLGIISRNDSDRIPNICNLIIVSKTDRLTNADKHEIKKKAREDTPHISPNLTESQSEGKICEEQTPNNTSLMTKQRNRITCDLSSLNQLTANHKYIMFPQIGDIAVKIRRYYTSSLDLADFFSQLPLD